jgi:hypothetical protein
VTTLIDANLGFHSSAHVGVLILSHDVGDSKVTDIADKFAFLGLLLNEVMSASARNGVVTGDVGGKSGAGGGLELESLDELVLRRVKFIVDDDLADLDTADNSADDEGVASFTGVVGVVVVFTVGKGFKVVATVEELRHISATGALNDELATGMVGSVISAVENQVIEDEKVTLASAGDSVELFLGDMGKGVHELDVFAHVDLMHNLHDDQGNKEGHGGNNPEMEPLHTAGVVGVDSGGGAPDGNEDEQPGQVLVEVAESHQEGGVGASLPSAEVRNEAGDDEGKRHKGNCHC